MRYSQQENIRVKNKIVEGLFSTLKQKSFSKISISELVKASAVSRSSYYRNFYNKEDVLDFYFDNLRQDVQNIESDNLFNEITKDNGIYQSIIIFYEERLNIKLLLDNNLGDYLYQVINEKILDTAGTMSTHSLERYRLFFYSGAVYSILINWINAGCLESPETITQIMLDYLQHGIIK